MSYIRRIEPKVEVFNSIGTSDISEFVQSVRTDNSTQTSVGTLNMVINPGVNSKISTTITHNRILNEVERRLKLNSIISVKLDKNSESHSFLGRIDNIYPRISSDGNSTRRELIVICSLLLPKLLIRDDIINAPLLQQLPAVKQILGNDRLEFLGWSRGEKKDGTGNYFAGEPEKAVRFILEKCIATNTTSILSAIGTEIVAKAFFNPEKAETLKFHFLKGETLFNPSLTAYSGPILNYIYECIDPHFYEVFFDTETGETDGLAYNTITIRPKPFSFKDYNYTPTAVRNWINFEALEPITKNSSLRLSDSTGTSDYELKNSFSCNFLLSLIASANSTLGHFGVQFPLANLKSVQTYGWRHLSLVSKLINFDTTIKKYNDEIKSKTSLDDIAKTLSEKGEKLVSELDYMFDKREKGLEWYAFPYFRSGPITWVGDENIRIGNRLVYEDQEYYDLEEDKIYKGVEYYIDSVAHDFNYGRFYKTTTGLTRGAPAGRVARWLNDNRKDFTGPTVNDYKTQINQTPKIDSIYKEIENVSAQWREITEL